MPRTQPWHTPPFYFGMALTCGDIVHLVGDILRHVRNSGDVMGLVNRLREPVSRDVRHKGSYPHSDYVVCLTGHS